MSAHAPSGNSAPYKLLGVYGEPIVTTIDFVLPNRRYETIRCGNKWFASLTTVTPVTARTSRIDVVAASRAHTDNQKIAELRAQINDVTAQVLTEQAGHNISLEERAELQQEIIDEVLGLGPLEDLMRDPAISEIMVNGPNMIYVERSGKLTLSDKRFNDERHLRTIIERIIAPLGRRIDYEAGVDHVDGRKIWVWARSSCDGECLAEASIVFIAPRDGSRPR